MHGNLFPFWGSHNNTAIKIGILLSSFCQLRLGVVLRHLSLSPYRKENLGNTKKVVEEFEKEYQQDMKDVRKQEREEETFRRRELPERFMVRKLFRWSDKKYNEEYWVRLERT